MKKLMVKTGEYVKDGQTKGRYTQVGVILENNKGEYALLDPTVNLAGCLIQQNAISQQPSARLMASVWSDDNTGAPQQTHNQNVPPPSAPTVEQGAITAPPPSHKAPSGDVFDDDIPF